MNLPSLQDYRRMLAQHVLEPVEVGQKVSAYYLRKPGGGLMESTLIVFTPEGIALMGDVTPGKNGDVSCRGYGAEWFAGASSHSYLCEKFLHKGWHTELAAEELRDGWHDHFDGDAGKRAKLNELADDVEERGAEWLRDELDEMGADTSDGIPGWGYNPSEAACLIAIQERFAALYPAVMATSAGKDGGQ